MAAGTSAEPRADGWDWEGAERARVAAVAWGSGRRGKETEVGVGLGWWKGDGRDEDMAATAEAELAAAPMVADWWCRPAGGEDDGVAQTGSFFFKKALEVWA